MGDGMRASALRELDCSRAAGFASGVFLEPNDVGVVGRREDIRDETILLDGGMVRGSRQRWIWE